MTKADEIVALLREIRDALVPAAQAVTDAEVGCPHPEDQRIVFTAMGDHGAYFKCRACGHLQLPMAS